MRTYDLACIFRPEEDHFKKGLEFVKALLSKAGAVIQKEDDWGERTLAYPIKKQDRGHYVVITAQLPPDSLVAADQELRLQTELLKFLFIVQEA